jgi:hypothetical protein
MTYTIYNTQSGEILRIIETVQDIELQLQTNEAYLQGKYNDITNWVKNGQITSRPEPPTEFHSFDPQLEQWVDPRTQEQILSEKWHQIRKQRNQLLQQSDWTQLPDVPIQTKELWATYRQQLRDVTNQADPFNITWPVTPN